MSLFFQKEFLSALCMTGITIFFAFQLSGLEGEAATIPLILLMAMAFINVLQYGLAIWHGAKGASILTDLKTYPFSLVLKLFALSVIYVCTLLWTGFYIGSFAYLWIGSLMANPDPVTPGIAFMRALWCGLFIGALYALFTLSLGVIIPTGDLWHIVF